MPKDCVTTPDNCVDCPALPPVEGRTGAIVVEPTLAWDAGANSQLARAGDWAIIRIQPALDAGGVVVGARGEREGPNSPARVEHALYFRMAGGIAFVSVLELGQQRTSPIIRAAADQFEIRRVAGVVTYYRNGSVIHVSTAPSSGTKIVTCCMYASGDLLA